MKFDQGFLDEICERVPISDVIGRRVSWHKKSRASIGDWWAPCVFHGEKTPSFHVRDKARSYHCFGCGVSGNHFKFLMEIDGLSFPQAVSEVAAMAGISMPDAKPLSDEQKKEYAKKQRERELRKAEQQKEIEAEKSHRVMSAGLIWKQTVPLVGTIGQTYFEWRCPGLAPSPKETEIRFHPALELDPDNPRGDTWPAVIARVSDKAGKGIAVWRIYIARDGCGKMKTKLGFSAKLGYGPSSGGAVRLGGIASKIGICEGVETGRAIRELGVPYPVWPTTSTSGMIGFVIPEGVQTVVVFPDPDGSKISFKKKHDGSEFISQQPGIRAQDGFIERNPGRDIRITDGAWDADYLSLLQKIRGVPDR